MGSSGIEIVKAVKYFNEIEILNKNTHSNANHYSIYNQAEKIRLEFSLQNCKNGDKYSINALFLEKEGKEEKDFKSEEKTSKDDEIVFENFYICDYYFEKEQNMQIIVYREDQKPFYIITTLATIVGSKHSSFMREIENKEKLIVKAVKLGNDKSYINININIKNNEPDNDYLKKNSLIFVITSNNRKIYSSESSSTEGNFDQIKIPCFILSPGYNVDIIRVKNNKVLASYNKLIEGLHFKKTNSNNNLQIKIPFSKEESISVYDNSEYNDNFSFFDFISSGVRLNLSIGIDFTGSNGHPLDKDTLHCIINEDQNDYEKVIKSIGNILSNYNYEKLYPVYGFGAILNSNPYGEVSMCFNINFKDNPEIHTINNVLNVYRACLDKLTFAGPTFFAPIIKTVIERIRAKNNNLEYTILLILTDGVIDDMEATIDALVEGSFLPLSVIIVGIGEADFSKMVILDGNDIPLVSSDKVRWVRDLVQFIQYNKYKNDEKTLTKEILEEIPRQIIEYYTQNNYNPDKIKTISRQNSIQNANSFKNNININNNFNNIYNNNQNNYNMNAPDLPNQNQIYGNQNTFKNKELDLPSKSMIYAHNKNKYNNNTNNKYDDIKLSGVSKNTEYENNNNYSDNINNDINKNNPYNNINLDSINNNNINSEDKKIENSYNDNNNNLYNNDNPYKMNNDDKKYTNGFNKNDNNNNNLYNIDNPYKNNNNNLNNNINDQDNDDFCLFKK